MAHDVSKDQTKSPWNRLQRRVTSGDVEELRRNPSGPRTTIGTTGDSVPSTPHKSSSGFELDDDEGWNDVPTVYFNKDTEHDPLDENIYESTPRKPIAPERKQQTSRFFKKGKKDDAHLLDEDNDEIVEEQDPDRGYSRLQASDLYQEDHVDQGTQYLFDDSKAMTPLSQMQATKDLLSDNQRIAYVSLCRLTIKFYIQSLRRARFKELKPAVDSAELWSMKIMGRIYQHMEISTDEQRMIEMLSEHGITTSDLVPSLMGTSVVPNPEYDPHSEPSGTFSDAKSVSGLSSSEEDGLHNQQVPNSPEKLDEHNGHSVAEQATSEDDVLHGVSTSLSHNEASLTIDIRWTILCDLFLVLIADSVYDARSRVFLEKMAEQLGLTWIDVSKFERRVTEALEIEEGVETLRQKDIIQSRDKAGRNRRYVMMGLATLGGGLIIGLSAGLLAPVIGAGLGAAFGTIGISGTTGFLAGTGGAAIITTGAAVTGGHIGATGMKRRTRAVRTFEFIPLYNARRVNLIITMNGWMAGENDDVRLPWSVIDPIMGDVCSIFWEPEMSKEMGSALKILTSEVTTQLAQQILQATLFTALMSSLQLPIMLTKLGYLVDNPWSNALDRAKAAGLLLADVLVKRNLGVRPIVLIGYSLGARAIFYALVELARVKAFGIVQDVFLFGSCVTASQSGWRAAASVVSGRFVNGFARNDWLLGYLFRATTGGLATVAGLSPVEHVPGLDNVELSHVVSGHFTYRKKIPILLKEVGFKVTSDTFDDFLDEKAEKERESKIAKKMRKEMKALEKAAKKQRKQWEKEGKVAPDGTVPDFEAASHEAETEQTTASDDLSIVPPIIESNEEDEDEEDEEDEDEPDSSVIGDEIARPDGVHYDLERIKETLRESVKMTAANDSGDITRMYGDDTHLTSNINDGTGLALAIDAVRPSVSRNVSSPALLGDSTVSRSEIEAGPSWTHQRNLSDGEPALSFWSSEGDLYQTPTKDRNGDQFKETHELNRFNNLNLNNLDQSNGYDHLHSERLEEPLPLYQSSLRRNSPSSSRMDLNSNPWG